MRRRGFTWQTHEKWGPDPKLVCVYRAELEVLEKVTADAAPNTLAERARANVAEAAKLLAEYVELEKKDPNVDGKWCRPDCDLRTKGPGVHCNCDRYIERRRKALALEAALQMAKWNLWEQRTRSQVT